MNEIIEAVATAIEDDLERQLDEQNGTWFQRSDETGVASADMDFVAAELARAAIEATLRAIRELSEDTLFAGAYQVEDCAAFNCNDIARHVWEQVIDALLASAAGARSAETNEDSAQSEGRQSGPSEAKGDAQPPELSRQQP